MVNITLRLRPNYFHERIFNKIIVVLLFTVNIYYLDLRRIDCMESIRIEILLIGIGAHIT